MTFNNNVNKTSFFDVYMTFFNSVIKSSLFHDFITSFNDALGINNKRLIFLLSLCFLFETQVSRIPLVNDYDITGLAFDIYRAFQVSSIVFILMHILFDVWSA